MNSPGAEPMDAFAAWALGGVLGGASAPVLRLRPLHRGYGEGVAAVSLSPGRDGVEVVFPPAVGDAGFALLDLPAQPGDYRLWGLRLDGVAVDDLASRVIAGDLVDGDDGRGDGGVSIAHRRRPPRIELDLRGRVADGTVLGLRIARRAPAATVAPASMAPPAGEDPGLALQVAGLVRSAQAAGIARIDAFGDALRASDAAVQARFEAADAARASLAADARAAADAQAAAFDGAAASRAALQASLQASLEGQASLSAQVEALRAESLRLAGTLAAMDARLARLCSDADGRLGARLARALGWRR